MQMHHRNVNDRKDTIKNIKRLIRRKEKENEQLDADLEELALSVAERRNVNEANGKCDNVLTLISFLRNFPFSHHNTLENKPNKYCTLKGHR